MSFPAEYKCPRCGSKRYKQIKENKISVRLQCSNCGKEWYELLF